ncbi:V-type ATP synthase subunit E [Spirochaeta isovalerica]|uniref:V/A-type H+-transporting ATPase subunit E n=1 Tax=Spirochaeta isovalerica TaxID=150 RepID=A0A841R6Z5_9SPIO|nr:V-type ATP synthase subunit E [Spirochaeta isovalerica]MBB6478977.1 V/A-type H+-transporting ATPase subunit E [Spirochaeta isovalerica]
MDVQLKELIEKIKTDGVKTAEDKAAEILRNAEIKSAEIIDNANKEAQRIKEDAKTEAARAEQSGREALKQAGRDLIIDVKGQVGDLFTGLIKAGTADALSGKALTEGIASVIGNWKGDVEDLSVLVSEKQLKEIDKELKSKLAKEIKAGLEVKPYKGAAAGFRVSEKDGKAFFDFTDEVLADYLSRYLNASLAETLKG